MAADVGGGPQKIPARVRDARSLTMALATPVLLLILMGYALTLDVNKVPLAVWDQSGTERSRELIGRFFGSHSFRSVST